MPHYFLLSADPNSALLSLLPAIWVTGNVHLPEVPEFSTQAYKIVYFREKTYIRTATSFSYNPHASTKQWYIYYCPNLVGVVVFGNVQGPEGKLLLPLFFFLWNSNITDKNLKIRSTIYYSKYWIQKLEEKLTGYYLKKLN